MAINIGTNFAYHGKLPNFDRDKFKTKAAMMAFDENSIDEGHLSYCEEDGNVYQYKSANTADATTGRWRLFKTDADAVLNGTSKNPIQNKAVFDALRLKADAAALDKYQPKYKADYVAKEDLSELPITEGVIDLNGYQLNMTSVDSQGTDLTIINGTISFSIGVTIKVSTLTFNNINITGNVEDRGVKINADSVKLINVFSPVMDAFNTYSQNDTNLIQQLKIYNSNIAGSVNAKEVFVYQSYISLTGNAVDNGIKLHAYNSYVLNDGYGTNNGSEWYNSRIELFEYPNGYIDDDGAHRYNSFDDTLKNNSENAPQTKVVYDALQLKADKTQLNDLATKTELNSKADSSELDNYTTTATTNAISADVTSLMNEVFVLTASASVTTNIAEVGTNPTVALTVDAKLGKGRTQVDEITIDGTKYTGEIPYTHSATATTTHTYNITVKKGTKTADASATINFYNASYYGVVDASKTSLTATEVKTLKTKEVKSGRSGPRTFNLTNQKACIAYPQSFGAAESIKDANGFDYLASYTRSEVTIDSVVYYVYLLSSPTTITDFKQIIN